MTRRELYRFIETIRAAAVDSGHLAEGRGCEQAVLRAFRLAMHRRRGRPVEAADGEAALLPLLDGLSVGPLLDREDLLGRVYQALNAPALESAYRATSRDRKKFAPGEIHTVSQLFTPRWVVEFLLHNTLGKLWIELHPNTRLRQKLNWLIERRIGGSPTAFDVGYTGGPPAPPGVIRPAGDIRLLDPACGTMNFGLVAYELLREMYLEEIDRAGEAGWNADPSVQSPAEIPAAVFRNNLFGIDIDPVALDVARATSALKAGVDLPDADWNLWQGDSLFDQSLGGRCEGRFDVVATNPPYVSSRNLPADHVARMKKRFPAAWRDLYACFIERSLEFARPGGRVGILAMQSFLFTGAYQKLRSRICDRAAMETLAHFGPGLFDIGNPGTLQTVAFVARKEAAAQLRAATSFTAFRLSDIPGEQKHAALQSAIDGSAPGSNCRFDRPQSALHDLPRRSWAYWVEGPLRQAFATYPRLAEISPPRQGLATTDNARFVRYWWEVEPMHRDSPARATPGKWFAYAKSGQFRRWHELPRHRVNWLDDGREIKQAIVDRYPYLNGKWRWVAKNTGYYGRGGITWSYLTSGRFSARRLEAGAIFDVAGSSLFPDDVPGMLAMLNSSAIHRLLEAINPTVNFQVGDLAELPIPSKIPAELGALTESAIEIQRKMDACDEIAPDFIAPMPWTDAVERMRSVSDELSRIEYEIDTGACALYGLHPEPPAMTGQATPDRIDLARRWVSFAVGLLLGRWGGDPPGRLLQIAPVDPDVVSDVREILGRRAGGEAADEIESHIGGIGSFLADDFYSWHVRMYRNRPPYWALCAGARVHLLAHDAAAREAVLPISKAAGITLPAGWERRIDDGIQMGLVPLRSLVAEPGLRKVLEKLTASGALPRA